MPDMPQSGVKGDELSAMEDKKQGGFSGYRIEREDTSANP